MKATQLTTLKDNLEQLSDNTVHMKGGTLPQDCTQIYNHLNQGLPQGHAYRKRARQWNKLEKIRHGSRRNETKGEWGTKVETSGAL